MPLSTIERCAKAKVWHAYHALKKSRGKPLERSKCKVLTQSLASVLQLSQNVMEDFEERFPLDRYDDGVSFDEYEKLINLHVIEMMKAEDQVDETMLDKDLESDDSDEFSGGRSRGESKVSMASSHRGSVGSAERNIGVSSSWIALDDLCWTLFSKQALSPSYSERISVETQHLLWQWYVIFSDADDDGVVKCPVHMEGDEVNSWLHYFFTELLALDFQPLLFEEPVHLVFSEVLDAIIGILNELKLSQYEFEATVKIFHDIVVRGLLRNGYQQTKVFARNTNAGLADIPSFLLRGISDTGYIDKGRKNTKKGQWKRRYWVLTLNSLIIYTNHNMNHKCGQIPMSSVISADPYREKDDQVSYYQIETATALFVLEIGILRNRNLWIRDIRNAIQCNRRQIDNVFLLKMEKRKMDRLEAKNKREAEAEERRQILARNEQLESENEKLDEKIQRVQAKLEATQSQLQEEKRQRMFSQSVEEAKIHALADSKKETIERLHEDIEEKQKELIAARALADEHKAESKTLRKELEEMKKEKATHLARIRELEARKNELLANVKQLQKSRSLPKEEVVTHRGAGAFPAVYPTDRHSVGQKCANDRSSS